MRALADRLSRTVLDRPVLTVTLFLCLGAVSAWIASHLHFDTAFDALLAPDTPELKEVRALSAKAGGNVRLMIAVGGKKQGRLPFAKKVVTALRKQTFIRYADVEFPVDYLIDRRIYFAPLEKLKKLKQELDREVQRARARANPLYVDLEDDDDDGKKDKDWQRFEKLEKNNAADLELKRFLESPDGKYLYIQAKPIGTSYKMAAGKVLLGQIKAVVAAQDPAAFGVTVRYAGTLPMNQEQHTKMNEDLRRASLIALALILGLMTLYIRQLLAPLILALPLLIGVAATLAVVQLTFGQLNLVSGFLVSALLGLGIDYEIHLYLRYLEELQQGRTPRAAMEVALQRTLGSNITAGLTTAARLLRDLHRQLSRLSRVRPDRRDGRADHAGGGLHDAPAAGLSAQPPRQARAAALFRRRLSAALRLADDRRGQRRADLLGGDRRASGALELQLQEAPRHLGDRQVHLLHRARARRVALTGGHLRRDPGPGSRRAALPRAAAEIEDLGGAALDLAGRPGARGHGREGQARGRDAQEPRVGGRRGSEDRRRQARHPRAEADQGQAWTLKDVPEVFRRPFRTIDGEGQFVIVWPRSEMVDEPEIVAWGGELTRIRADLRAKGIPVGILGENRIGARVLSEMRAEAPLILSAAAIAVILILIMNTRSATKVVLITGALGVGLAWMLGVMHLVSLEINVFNMAVLATIIGLGLDNAVHIQHRYSEEGRGSLPKVVATTGGASFLASATTAIGFGAAVTAHHNGVQTLGWLALIGFTSTFVASTVFFPAVLRVLEGAQQQGVERDNDRRQP
jgi:predicted RND superfamily exporter protein